MFYLDRASKTRYNGTTEKMPSADELAAYGLCMDHIFAQRAPPPTFTEADIFERGDLRRDVFLKAVSNLNPASSPGFPYIGTYSTNEELNYAELYDAVNYLLQNWIHVGPETLFSMKRDDDRISAFISGLVPPAHIFIKGEPTKIAKIARLIFGVSVIYNVIARIIFGDYLRDLTKTWHTASHKVGLDFSSREGLDKLGEFVVSLETERDKTTEKFVSDDIRGWEYQIREWMHQAWHRSYMKRANATTFHRRLQTCYLLSEELSLVMLSDGTLLNPKRFFTFSGKVTTHIENSDERSALAMVDYFHERKIITVEQLREQLIRCAKMRFNMVNGDDCVRLSVPNSGPTWSEGLGFEHTDVHVENLLEEFHFSSQLFYWKCGKLERRPDSLVKSAYNLFAHDATSGAYLDTLLYMVNHPAWALLDKLAVSLRRIGGGRQGV